MIGGVIGAAGCGTSQPAADIPPRALPLPTVGIAGREVTVYPLTLIATASQLNWSDAVGPRREALARADSLLHTFLVERAPEVTWIAPEALRHHYGPLSSHKESLGPPHLEDAQHIRGAGCVSSQQTPAPKITHRGVQ